jgi:serine/threonine protein kinase
MTDSAETERHSVDKLAEAFIANFRAGRCPSVDEYVEQFPELADELRGLIKVLAILEQNVSPSDRLRSSALGSEAPRQIGEFLLVREVGRGGMGVVYEAVQQSLNRQVALKVLCSPGLLDPAQLERFRREALAAARLQHSHIVPVFGFGAHDGTYYYAMQYVSGQSLDRAVESLRLSCSTADPVVDAAVPTAGRSLAPDSSERRCCSTASEPDTSATVLSETEFSTSAGRRQFYRNVARIGLQAAEALAYAHSEGVLHRDVKPSNLLLDAKGNIWITDFGLAKAEGDDELTHTGDFIGTLRYTAPERLEGWSDRRSDIYSLGATLYELLTLQPFFSNKSRAELLRCIA